MAEITKNAELSSKASTDRFATVCNRYAVWGTNIKICQAMNTANPSHVAAFVSNSCFFIQINDYFVIISIIRCQVVNK